MVTLNTCIKKRRGKNESHFNFVYIRIKMGVTEV